MVAANELNESQKKQLMEMLAGGWESPADVLKAWHPIIETYLFIMDGDEIMAVGSWRIHKMTDDKFDFGINMVLFAVNKKAQGKGYGTKMTLLSFLYSFREAKRKFGKNISLLYWGVSANPIVIDAYIKNFPFYITPKLDNTYDKRYGKVALKLAKYMEKEKFISKSNPFLMKNCVYHKFTQTEVEIQNSYIERMGERFQLDLNIENNDRLIIILGAFFSRLDYHKLYFTYIFLLIRGFLKRMVKS